HERTGAQAEVMPWIAYARARLALLGGDFAGAENALEEARSRWQALGEPVLLARSGLGLTQVLAVQGRYADAQAVVSEAVGTLAAIRERDVETELIYLDARSNAATLRSYQEQHAEAATEFAAVQAAFAALLENADDDELAAELRARLGLVGIDAAISQTYLDNPVAAAATLAEAIALLDQPEVRYDRGALTATWDTCSPARAALPGRSASSTPPRSICWTRPTRTVRPNDGMAPTCSFSTMPSYRSRSICCRRPRPISTARWYFSSAAASDTNSARRSTIARWWRCANWHSTLPARGSHRQR